MLDASKNLNTPSWFLPEIISSTIFVPGLTVAIVLGSNSAAYERSKPQ